MATQNSHIILKQVLEIVLPKNLNPFQFQKEIGELSKKKLEPALEKLFDSYSTPIEVLQIDLLEVNIGNQHWLPSGDAFVEAVVTAVEEQLKSKIKNGKGEIKRKPVEQNNFEEWVHFLDNGYFPTATRKPDHAYYQELIPNFLKKHPSFKKPLIKLLAGRPRSLERLIKQHPESFLIKLFAALTDRTKSQIEAYKQEIQRLVDTAVSSPEQSALSTLQFLPQTFWKWVFGNLKTNTTRSFGEKELVIGYLANWVNIQKPNYQKGESFLWNTLKKTLQESPGRFPLLSTLKNLLEESVISEVKDSHKPNLGQNLDSPDYSTEEGTRNTRDKEDKPSLKQIEADSQFEIGKSKPVKVPKKSERDDLSHKITNEEEQQTEKEKRKKGLIKSRDDPETKDYSEPLGLSQTVDRALYQEFSDEEPAISPEKKKSPKKELPPGKKASEHQEGSYWYINHAGVVLLHTFLTVFFKKCELTVDNQFIDEAASERAAQLVLHLATGKEETPEFDLVLAKFLCGIPLEIPINGKINLSETEISESNKLLEAAIEHWGKLKKTSPDGLREGFLQREGKLEKRAHGWYLTVEQHSIDILLNYLPWNLRMVKLPWMEELLKVEWE